MVFAVLGRRQPEPRERGCEAGIDFAAANLRWATPGMIGWIDGRIDDDHAREPVAVFRAGQDGDKAAERVRDDDRLFVAIKQPGVLADSQLFDCEGFQRVRLAPVAVAHAGERHGDHMVLIHEIGRDKVPPVGMSAVAVHQQQAGFRAVAPALIVDSDAVRFDEMGLVGRRDRLLEPFGRRRFLAVVNSQWSRLGRHADRLISNEFACFRIPVRHESSSFLVLSRQAMRLHAIHVNSMQAVCSGQSISRLSA